MSGPVYLAIQGAFSSNLYATTDENGAFRFSGMISANNGYTQTSTGRLLLEIMGSTVGTQLRRLSVTGTAALSGTLEISRSAGYVPKVGASLNILSFGACSGEIATVEGMAIDASRRFQARDDDANKRVVLDVVAIPGINAEATMQMVADESRVDVTEGSRWQVAGGRWQVAGSRWLVASLDRSSCHTHCRIKRYSRSRFRT